MNFKQFRCKIYECAVVPKEPSKNRKRKSIAIILQKKVCCGCGACSVICPTSSISIVYGVRFNFPKVSFDTCIYCGKCLKVCPSAFLVGESSSICAEDDSIAPLECFLIHSKDDEIRLNSSSGGFVTGMILHLMDKGVVDGAIVAKTECEHPCITESLLACDKESVSGARASKYTPVSNCTALTEVLNRPGRYIFVGTPCMVQALTNLENYIPKLKKRIVLSIGLVCAGTPSRLSTVAYLDKNRVVNLKDVNRIDYRGGGWPGRFRVFANDGRLLVDRPYLNDFARNVFGSDHYLRCWNCSDHFAQRADFSVSDPWCDEMLKNETKGRSAVMVRSERGMRSLKSAVEAGDLIADRIAYSDMLGYNKKLVVDDNHQCHSWMDVYQLVFFSRLRLLVPVLRRLLRRELVGMMTTLKARLDKNYFH